MQSVVGRTLELEQQLAQVKQQCTQQEATTGGELQGVHKLINRASSVSALLFAQDPSSVRVDQAASCKNVYFELIS